jgi:hypothetical protein
MLKYRHTIRFAPPNQSTRYIAKAVCGTLSQREKLSACD